MTGPSREVPEAVVIGGSAGGARALGAILARLPADLGVPVLVTLHLARDGGHTLPAMLQRSSRLEVTLAVDKTHPRPGHVYLAPPDYHLLVEKKDSLSLSQDPRVNFSRPSIDVLFESAAEVFGPTLIGVLCTGANDDGSHGLELIQTFGGITIVEDPASAEVATMPASALERLTPDHVRPIQQIGPLLAELCPKGGGS